MAKEKRIYSAETHFVKSMKLQPGKNLESHVDYQAVDRPAKVDNQFSREMIQRLIEWFKQD